MFLLSELKHGVVIPAPTARKGKFGKARREPTLGFTVLRHLWCHLGSLSVAPPGRGISAVTGISLEGSTGAAGTRCAALPRVSSPAGTERRSVRGGGRTVGRGLTES